MFEIKDLNKELKEARAKIRALIEKEFFENDEYYKILIVREDKKIIESFRNRKDFYRACWNIICSFKPKDPELRENLLALLKMFDDCLRDNPYLLL